MAYNDELQKISRTPVTLIIMTLDFCRNDFGVSPCAASGTPCYNTFPTCKNKTNYSKGAKNYKFTSCDTAVPFSAGERPYIKSIRYMPTEIKDRDNLTVNARVNIEMWDEPDTDRGIDPYISQRSSVQGTFWRKLLVRNANYKGRRIRSYQGFLGLTEAEFEKRFIGIIDNIKVGDDNVISIEVADMLKKLDKIEIPPKLDIELVADIDETASDITLTSLEGLDKPEGYVRLNDEIIHYTSVANSKNQITSCNRGAFSTTAAVHTAKEKVQKVRVFPFGNPFDHMKEMLFTDADVDADDVDTESFDEAKAWPGGEIYMRAVITESKKLSDLFFELVDLCDCKAWVAENLKITIKKNLPNEPGRAYAYFSDAENFIDGSTPVDLNEKSRITRIALYWQKDILGKDDDVNAYRRIDVAVDGDAEGPNELNDEIEKKIFCRWISAGNDTEERLSQFVKNCLARQLFRLRDAQPLLDCEVEIKDEQILTGAFVKVSTDEILQPDGNPINGETFQVVRREPNDNKVRFRLLKLTPSRFAFFAPNDTPDYDEASEEQREYCFFTDNDGLINDGPGYSFY
jgi:hypothetical protein